MSLGAAATLRLVGALLRFVSDLFITVADAAELAGDPAISTPCALVMVGLVGAGHYSKGLFALLAFTFFDLISKEFGLGPGFVDSE